MILLTAAALSQQLDDQSRRLAHDIFKQLIEINTTDSVGNVSVAAEAMAQRLRDAGFAEKDIFIGGPTDRKKNVVVRLHGSGAHKRVLLIGHLDVVEARREDWTTDPFQFVEKDGYFYGRGAQDMKDGDAIMITTLIRFKKEGYVPDRDIILAMTADEEGGDYNGVDWLIKNKRDLIDAEFVLNHDGGGVTLLHGKPLEMELDATEKRYADYTLSVTNRGGHSSLPVPDNAIYHLANALVRVQNYKFPLELNNVTRAYYKAEAKIETGQRAQDMLAILKDPPDLQAAARLSKDAIDNSTLHTTCVATRLNAGHANNALPQLAQANVNCRIEPGHSAEDIRHVLEGVLADPQIKVTYVETTSGNINTKAFAPPPLRPELMTALRTAVDETWPGLPIIPSMADGASDAVYTNAAGMPTYGISGDGIERDDTRAHGKDERMGEESFYRGVQFYYLLMKALTKPAA